MGNKAVGHRPEPSQDLARSLLSGNVDWETVGRQYGSGTVRATKDELERSKLPLRHYEPKLDGSLTRKVRDALCIIGAKIRPDLSADQATAWVDAMVVALGDLPPQVAAKACNRAVHVPFLFPSEVEAKIRGLAQEHMDRIAAAIHRAETIEKAIRDAIREDRPKQLTTRVADPLTTEEVHNLQRQGGMCAEVVRLGLKLGHITQDQLLDPETINEGK